MPSRASLAAPRPPDARRRACLPLQWIVAFQFFSIIYAAYVVMAAPAKRFGALGLFTVLTTSTFLFTCSVLNAPAGAYALSHNVSGTPASVIGTKSSLVNNGVFATFIGLIIMDVANIVFVLTVADEDAAPAPAAVEAKPVDAPAAEAPAAEAAV